MEVIISLIGFAVGFLVAVFVVKKGPKGEQGDQGMAGSQGIMGAPGRDFKE